MLKANSNDENGIVYGKWTEPYTPYVAPWDWLGSGTILEKYLLSNGVPVRYGQCWVFAGITTSMARSLGIPARTITNFASAHDTDNSLTVDRYERKLESIYLQLLIDLLFLLHTVFSMKMVTK